jgi:hypothetical protein
MKKILIFAMFLFSIGLFISCEQNENPQVDFSGGFLQVAQESSLASEDSGATTVTVLYGGNASDNTSGITVNFSVT